MRICQNLPQAGRLVGKCSGLLLLMHAGVGIYIQSELLPVQVVGSFEAAASPY